MTEPQLPPTQDTPAAIPPPPAVANVAGVPQAAVSGRPTAVLVIGILLLVYGGFGVLSTLFSAVQLATGTTAAVVPIGVQAVSWTISAATVVLAIVIGIGLLRMLPWARKVTITALLVLFAVNTITSIVTFFYTQQALPGMDETTTRVVQISMYIGLAVGFIIGAGLTALFIYLLTRPQVVQAFRNAGEK